MESDEKNMESNQKDADWEVRGCEEANELTTNRIPCIK